MPLGRPIAALSDVRGGSNGPHLLWILGKVDGAISPATRCSGTSVLGSCWEKRHERLRRQPRFRRGKGFDSLLESVQRRYSASPDVADELVQSMLLAS